ncbi:MAG: helix-turn-helix domain-containing protein, partial [Steroidobacteraceae bacterium]
MSKTANIRKTTAENILDAAEQLFADRGVDAVSVRQIATAAGSSNNFAVQYHFGDKAGLVHALFERRLPALDARRGELLAEVAREGRLQDVQALLQALLLPMWEQRDSNGRRSYVAFLAAHWRFTPQSDLRLRHKDLAPTTELIFSLIRAAMP